MSSRKHGKGKQVEKPAEEPRKSVLQRGIRYPLTKFQALLPKGVTSISDELFLVANKSGEQYIIFLTESGLRKIRYQTPGDVTGSEPEFVPTANVVFKPNLSSDKWWDVQDFAWIFTIEDDLIKMWHDKTKHCKGGMGAWKVYWELCIEKDILLPENFMSVYREKLGLRRKSELVKAAADINNQEGDAKKAANPQQQKKRVATPNEEKARQKAREMLAKATTELAKKKRDELPHRPGTGTVRKHKVSGSRHGTHDKKENGKDCKDSTGKIRKDDHTERHHHGSKSNYPQNISSLPFPP